MRATWSGTALLADGGNRSATSGGSRDSAIGPTAGRPSSARGPRNEELLIPGDAERWLKPSGFAEATGDSRAAAGERPAHGSRAVRRPSGRRHRADRGGVS